MSGKNSPNFNSSFGFDEEAAPPDTTDYNDFGEGQGHLIHHHTPSPRFILIPSLPPKTFQFSISTFGSPTTTLNAGTITKVNDLHKAIDNFGYLASVRSVTNNFDRRVESTLEQIPRLGNLLMDSIEAYNEERDGLRRDGLRRDRAASRKAREETENIKAEYVAMMAQMSVTPRPMAPLRRSAITALPPPTFPKIPRLSESGMRPGQGHMTTGTDTSILSEATTNPFNTSELLAGFTELTPYKLNPEEALSIATGKFISELSDPRYNIEVVFCPPEFAEHEMTDFLRAIRKWDEKDIKWRTKGMDCCPLCHCRAAPGKCKPKSVRDPKRPCAPCNGGDGHYCVHHLNQGYLALYVGKAGGSKLPLKSAFA